MKNNKRKALKIFLVILGMIFTLTAVCLIYLNIGQYKAKSAAKLAMLGNDGVKVTDSSRYIFFDGFGEDKALIFYPGAKVESMAYAPLCEELAKSGTDCFILKVPMNFALLGINRADSVIEAFSYEKWYIGGHSLGGVAAGMYAKKHIVRFDGILLLASYANKKLEGNNGFRALSVYGSNDGVLNISKMNKKSGNLPDNSTQICIEGGNHAQFGDYGRQHKDKEAGISPKEQIEYVVEAWKTFTEAE